MTQLDCNALMKYVLIVAIGILSAEIIKANHIAIGLLAGCVAFLHTIIEAEKA